MSSDYSPEVEQAYHDRKWREYTESPRFDEWKVYYTVPDDSGKRRAVVHARSISKALEDVTSLLDSVQGEGNYTITKIKRCVP